jgi:hypothetical protein
MLAIAALFVLQVALCPAICLAGTPERAAAPSGYAITGLGPAPSQAEEPCHGGRPDAPQDVPPHGDDSLACTSCSAETPLAYTPEKVSHPPGLAVSVFFPAITAALKGRSLIPFEPEHGPPPPRLYLLKNSFLL